MAIAVKCACGHQVAVADKYAGARIKCPMCQQAVTVPTAFNATAPAAAAAPAKPSAPPASAEAGYSISEFVRQSGEQDHGQGLFELEQARLLEVNLNGMVWTKKGSMVAYLGNVKFTREGILEHGFMKFFKK